MKGDIDPLWHVTADPEKPVPAEEGEELEDDNPLVKSAPPSQPQTAVRTAVSSRCSKLSTRNSRKPEVYTSTSLLSAPLEGRPYCSTSIYLLIYIFIHGVAYVMC